MNILRVTLPSPISPPFEVTEEQIGLKWPEDMPIWPIPTDVCYLTVSHNFTPLMELHCLGIKTIIQRMPRGTAAKGSRSSLGTPTSKGLSNLWTSHSHCPDQAAPLARRDSDNHIRTPSFSTSASEPKGSLTTVWSLVKHRMMMTMTTRLFFWVFQGQAVHIWMKRLASDAHLRQQITSLEGRLQQEIADHNISRKMTLSRG